MGVIKSWNNKPPLCIDHMGEALLNVAFYGSSGRYGEYLFSLKRNGFCLRIGLVDCKNICVNDDQVCGALGRGLARKKCCTDKDQT